MRVYSFIAKMTGHKLAAEMKEEKLSVERIRDAVRQHRKRNPYGLSINETRD